MLINAIRHLTVRLVQAYMWFRLGIANWVEFLKTKKETQGSVVPLADLNSLKIPKVCRDICTRFTVLLVSWDFGYVYKLVFGLLPFDILCSCRRYIAKNDFGIDRVLTLLTPTILPTDLPGPITCDGTAILSSTVAQTIPQAWLPSMYSRQVPMRTAVWDKRGNLPKKQKNLLHHQGSNLSLRGDQITECNSSLAR
jgi:hypothetical protein